MFESNRACSPTAANRMVHFHHAISDEELYAICTRHVADLEDVLAALLDWISANPDG